MPERLVTLEFQGFCPAEIAHPDDENEPGEYSNVVIIATEKETREQFLVWCAYGWPPRHFSLSREDPRYGTDDYIEIWDVEGLPTVNPYREA